MSWEALEIHSEWSRDSKILIMAYRNQENMKEELAHHLKETSTT